MRAFALAAALGGLSGSPVSVVGCKKEPPPPAPPAAASTPPPDRLAPGEPAPGMVFAFELQLPRGSFVERTFGDTVYARVPVTPEAAATFIAHQAEEQAPVIGPSGTVFPRLHVRESTTGKYFRVEVRSATGGTQVIVDKLGDPKPPEPKLPAEEALKKVGKTADGKWLDPTRLE